MDAPRLSLVWAMSENGVIGRGNALPWRLPVDLHHFRSITMGHHILMGRRTYESFKRPLPGRTHVVVTRDPAYHAAPGVVVAPSLERALAALPAGRESFVVGGANLYAQTLALATRLYVTFVHAHVEGDARFPDVDWSQWREVRRETRVPDTDNAFSVSFTEWERRASA